MGVFKIVAFGGAQLPPPKPFCRLLLQNDTYKNNEINVAIGYLYTLRSM